jgi:hypothetical protein
MSQDPLELATFRMQVENERERRLCTFVVLQCPHCQSFALRTSPSGVITTFFAPSS